MPFYCLQVDVITISCVIVIKLFNDEQYLKILLVRLLTTLETIIFIFYQALNLWMLLINLTILYIYIYIHIVTRIHDTDISMDFIYEYLNSYSLFYSFYRLMLKVKSYISSIST
jgi:hypothetical protein